MIVGEFPPFCGGIGNYVYRLSKILIEKGFDITVITRGSSCKLVDFTYYDNIKVWKVRFLPIYPYHVYLHGIFLNMVISQYGSQFDIIHLHNPLVPFPNTQHPVLITEHGTVHGDIENSSHLDIRSHSLHLFIKILVKQDVNVITQSNLVTAVSDACAQDIKTLYNIDRQISVVKNGVDTDFFKPGINTIREKNVILYTGRLDSRKGLVDLIESAKILCKKNSDVQFILTGKGPNKKYLLRKISQSNLTERVILKGYVAQDELIRLYQTSTIYVLPSYYEGLPTTLLEAMACGMPSIATNVKGNAEVIQSGKNGILVPPRNPEFLSEKIQELLDNKKRRDDIGNFARDYVVKNYDWQKIVENFLSIYQSMGIKNNK